MGRNVTSRRVDLLIWAFLIGLIGYILTKADYGPLFRRMFAERGISPRGEVQLWMPGFVNMLQQYNTEYGRFPVGTNSQIMDALRGSNPAKIVFFEVPGPLAGPNQLNITGELIDPWETPYRFDLSDPKNPRVWSCGENRRDDGGAEGSDDIPSWR